jgi:putative endonuclease
MARTFYVYIHTNRSGTLYVGVTNDLRRRLEEHRAGKAGSFTTRYKLDRLLYFEETNSVTSAIEREKQLKGWNRQRRLRLVQQQNQTWRDLSEDWYDSRSPVIGRDVTE